VSDEYSQDDPPGTEAFEQGNEALDEESRLNPDFVEDLEQDPPSIPQCLSRGHSRDDRRAPRGGQRRPPMTGRAVRCHSRQEAHRGRPVVITGTSDERPLAERVAAAAGLDPHCVLAATTDLDGLTRIVAAAGRVVCGDTGIAHLASALGTPSVVLFGPVPPAEWGPPPDRPHHVALWAGQRGDPHAEKVDPGLLAITVAEVERAVINLPARPARQPLLAGILR
jgi:hypothetical protein